jgi:hypothetical protein
MPGVLYEVPGERELLLAKIAREEHRQEGRRDFIVEIQRFIDTKDREIANLRARLEQLDG